MISRDFILLWRKKYKLWRPDQQEETKGWNGRLRDFYTGNDYIQDSADRSVNGHSKKIYVFVYVVFYICLELHCMISILLVIIYYSFYTYVFVLIKKNIAIFTKRLLMSLMILLNLITKKTTICNGLPPLHCWEFLRKSSQRRFFHGPRQSGKSLDWINLVWTVWGNHR